MKRTVPRLEGPARAVARGELIGSQCTITVSRDPGLVGRSGIVVDETLHTLRIREEGAAPGVTLLVPKVACTFRFTAAPTTAADTSTPAGRAQPPTIDVPGAAIEYRPWERIKKVR